MPDDVAAQLVSMPFSAISLIDDLGIGEGDWLVQNAANGAVGRLVAQLATARGINVVGLVRRAEGVRELAAQGIGRIVATDSDGWQDAVRALTGDAPLRVGIDSVGGSASGRLLSLLADGGTLVVFGAMESPIMRMSSGDLIFRDLTVRGFWASTVGARMAADKRAALFAELVSRISAGVLTLPVAGTFDLGDIADALAATAEAGRVGKVLLRP